MGSGGAGRETSIADGEKPAEFLAVSGGDFRPLLALRLEPVEDLASPSVLILAFFLLKRPIAKRSAGQDVPRSQESGTVQVASWSVKQLVGMVAAECRSRKFGRSFLEIHPLSMVLGFRLVRIATVHLPLPPDSSN